MRSLKNLTAVLAFVLSLTIVASADDAEKAKTPDAPKELKNQTYCPVMGGKIDSTIYTDIQGQRVYHCCPMCSAKLKADPDKYFNKAAEEGILFENIQTTCPVTGEKLDDKLVYTDYNGRRVYFCCLKCRNTFKEDPEKYLQKMNSDATADQSDMKKMDHSSHGGH